MTNQIYLDGNATTAVLPAAITAAVQAMAEGYGNPSSTHATGLRAKAMMETVRACAARLLGIGDGRLMFNSGATEGIQTAVLSALCAVRARRNAGETTGNLLLYGATEHKAVPESLAHWNRLLGLNLTLQALPVDAEGLHDLAALRAFAPKAALVCTMAANNETGVVSDLAGIEAVLHASATTAYWLVDCVQALGKLQLNLAGSRIDYAPFSGHKLYAPKGIGMLYVRAGAPVTPLIVGGGQETGLRSGTENMAGIAALGAVLAALEAGDTFCSHAQLAAYRARLGASLRSAFPGVVFNHPWDKALPTTLNFSVPGLSSRALMDVFDAAQMRVSAGSACSSAKAMPSYVLDAMQVPAWRSSGAIRMSFGPLTDAATIDAACDRIERCGAALRTACLIPSEQTRLPHDGVLQLGVDGVCSWLLLDAASNSCVVIDPLPEQADAIVAHVRCHGYQVRAILGCAPNTDRETLAGALGRQFDRHAQADAFGWPLDFARTALADGRAAPCLPMGQQVLARVLHEGDQVSYLLGGVGGASLAATQVRFAFTGHAAQHGLGGLITTDTLLCPSRDPANQFCTSLRAQAQERTALGAELQLDASRLDEFLHTHPDALLIDVREPYEYAAAGAAGPGGRAALSVPLSRLTNELDAWLHGEPVPLLLFCRSGNRSIKAVQCLRRLGYQPAWSLSGGLALAPLALAA